VGGFAERKAILNGCCGKEWTWCGVLFGKICFQGSAREHSERSALLSDGFPIAGGVNSVAQLVEALR
jgi:hypothetical protein